MGQFSKNSKPTSFSTSNVREDPLPRSAYSNCLHFSDLAHLPPPVRYPEEEIAPFPVPRPAAGVHVGLCAVDIFCVFNKHPVNDILIQSTRPSNTPSPHSAITTSSASPHHLSSLPAYQNSSDRRLPSPTPHSPPPAPHSPHQSTSTRTPRAPVHLLITAFSSLLHSAASRHARFKSSRL